MLLQCIKMRELQQFIRNGYLNAQKCIKKIYVNEKYINGAQFFNLN